MAAMKDLGLDPSDGERQRRRLRAGPPLWRDGRADHDHPDLRAQGTRQEARGREPLHRWRRSDGRRPRARVTSTLPSILRRPSRVAHVTLNRPGKRNALDRATIAALTAGLGRCGADASVRAVLLTGAGDVFCAGADLAEMQAQAHASEADNLRDAEALASMLATLDALPKPTVARVNGDGYGGALGLLACCDIVVVADHAKFAFTEVRLGIIPAVISPFVLGKIGERAARRYFLTSETLTAATLADMGLAHEVAPAGALEERCTQILDALLKRGAPAAQAEAKTSGAGHGPGGPRGSAARPREKPRAGWRGSGCRARPRKDSPPFSASARRAGGRTDQPGGARDSGPVNAIPSRARGGGRPCPNHAQIPWPSWKSASVAYVHGCPQKTKATVVGTSPHGLSAGWCVSRVQARLWSNPPFFQ